MLALYEVAVSLSNAEEPHLVAQKIVSVARDLLGTDAAAVCWLDTRTGRLRRLGDTDPDHRLPETRWPGQGAMGIAFETDQPVVVPDYGAWKHALKLPAELKPASVLALPLRVRGRTLGSIGVACLGPRDFGAHDVQLLQLISGLAAPTLELALRFQQLRGTRRGRPAV